MVVHLIFKELHNTFEKHIIILSVSVALASVGNTGFMVLRLAVTLDSLMICQGKTCKPT